MLVGEGLCASTIFWRFQRFAPKTTVKSKIECPQKCREGRFLAISSAARVLRIDTTVCGRFCTKRCGPSRRRVGNAPVVLKKFVRQPKKTFATVSARTRRVEPTMSALGG